MFLTVETSCYLLIICLFNLFERERVSLHLLIHSPKCLQQPRLGQTKARRELGIPSRFPTWVTRLKNSLSSYLLPAPQSMHQPEAQLGSRPRIHKHWDTGCDIFTLRPNARPCLVHLVPLLQSKQAESQKGEMAAKWIC